jgi:hypothetical protein
MPLMALYRVEEISDRSSRMDDRWPLGAEDKGEAGAPLG